MSTGSEEKCELDFTQDLLWERAFLKNKCKRVGLEKEFTLYIRRLHTSSLGVFLCLHVVVTLFHCFLLLTTCEVKDPIYVDVVSYLVAATILILVLSINFNVDIIPGNGSNWIIYVTSAIAVVIMATVDISLHIYHYYENSWVVTSFYDTYILFMIYWFLPIPQIKGPLLLGLVASIIYMSYFIIYLASRFREDFLSFKSMNFLFVDILHFISFNLLGVFYRFTSEIIVRSSFLDRHQYVMEDIWLRNARAQEKLLLHSILPPQIAQPFQDDIRNRIASAGKHRSSHMHIMKERIMAIQIMPEVSILYADVVNYTNLTTVLSVKALVTLLHDLYARFDIAASRFRVHRIKFLGDCYYCVAGLIYPDPDHAKCCVDLGHCMITHIREVRALRNLNIDMRIGVHSGSILAGVIGATKLQYDIWGRDVMIANKLESTGLAGHVHISERTLEMIIDNTYEILPGTEMAREDPFLQKLNVKTFLIAAIEQTDNFATTSDRRKHSSYLVQPPSRSNLDQRSEETDQELQDEFRKMPLGIFYLSDFFRYRKGEKKEKTKNSARPLISFYFLHFRDPRLEYSYMRQPDYMLKYSVFIAWWIGLCLAYIQTVNHDEYILKYYMADCFVVFSLSLLLFITWYKNLCIWYKNLYDRFFTKKEHKYGSFSCYLFSIAEYFQRSLIVRMGVYMFIITLYFFTISIVLTDCDQEEFEILHIESKLYLYEPDINMCFHPWALTNMLSLIIGMSLIFTRIPMMMKTLVGILTAVIYEIIIFFQFEYVFHHSYTTNPFFLAEYAHSSVVIIAFVSLYLSERQSEFNSKVNYNWRIELLKKQQDSYLADRSINILLTNILPAHVVNLYMTSLEKNELYYEDYNMVAVMFASLVKFHLDLPSLRVLNEIICEFDKILLHYRQQYSVEKIKIVNCTYMAACGLDLRFAERLKERHETGDSITQEVSRAQRFFAAFRKHNEQVTENEEVVFVLTTFALDLIRTLWICNNVYKNIPVDRTLFTGDIRIGISSGEVMAGVVGASQVHYDIWGNAVNMASRMDSTGLAGQIQVTEETALILQKFGIECEYRGMTFVKGRGILPTYFVGITDIHEFKHTPEFAKRQQTTWHSQRSQIVTSKK